MFRYVTLLAFFVSTVLAFGPPGHEHFEKCIAESGANPEMFKGPPPADAVPDEKMKCFHACMMKSKGEMGADGTVDFSKAIESLPADIPDKDKVTEAMKECSTKKGANECDTAFEIFKCMHDKLPHHHHHHHHPH